MLRLYLLALTLNAALAGAVQWEFSIQKAMGSPTSFGNLVARKDNGPWGLVGDDWMDENTAHYFCRMAGYSSANYWTKYKHDWNNVDDSNKLARSKAESMGFTVGKVNCNGTSGVFENDCSYHFRSGCCEVADDPLVLSCAGPVKRVARIVYGEGNQRNGTTERNYAPMVYGMGSVVVTNSSGNSTLSSLICAPASGGYSKNVTDAICRESGYTTSVGSTTHIAAGQDNRVNCDWAVQHGLNKIMLDIQGCEANAMDLSECSHTPIPSEDCNLDDTVVVNCRLDGAKRKLLDLQVLANPDRSRSGTLSNYAEPKGTVVATIKDLVTGETLYSLVSAVANVSQQKKIASAICRNLGYLHGNYHIQREVLQEERLSCGFLEERGILHLISDFSCETESSDPMACNYRYGEGDDWRTENAMVVECLK